jgi:fumarate reductase subunit D
VTLLKLINGARHVLGIQHGNQSGRRLFSIPRSSIAETLIFIVIVMVLIAAR